MRSLWIHFVYFHVHAELVQLKKGIDETLNFGLVTCIHPLETRSLFAASSLFEVTPQYLCDSFVVKYSDNGSNKRTKEEAIIMYWYEYIENCYQENVLNLGNILKFLSGTAKLPASGFKKVPSVNFMDEEQLPTISTRVLCLLPFREVWVYWSMKNSRRRWITVYLVHMDLVTFEFSHFVVLPVMLALTVFSSFFFLCVYCFLSTF